MDAFTVLFLFTEFRSDLCFSFVPRAFGVQILEQVLKMSSTIPWLLTLAVCTPNNIHFRSVLA